MKDLTKDEIAQLLGGTIGNGNGDGIELGKEINNNNFIVGCQCTFNNSSTTINNNNYVKQCDCVCGDVC